MSDVAPWEDWGNASLFDCATVFKRFGRLVVERCRRVLFAVDLLRLSGVIAVTSLLTVC